MSQDLFDGRTRPAPRDQARLMDVQKGWRGRDGPRSVQLNGDIAASGVRLSWKRVFAFVTSP